jgi:hypothetical protein
MTVKSIISVFIDGFMSWEKLLTHGNQHPGYGLENALVPRIVANLFNVTGTEGARRSRGIKDGTGYDSFCGALKFLLTSSEDLAFEDKVENEAHNLNGDNQQCASHREPCVYPDQ